MPRGRSGGMRSAPAPQRPPPRAAAPPARPPPPPPQAGSQGPGLFGQMAATAGGVAIGSAVGHTIGNMMTGGGGGQAPAEQAQYQQQTPQQQQYSQPCEFELKQFLECANQGNLSVCDAFNEQLKECRARYGI